MFYNPYLHHRRSIRLANHDYSLGIYFVTICCFQRQHFFGEIENNQMIKSPAGFLAEKFWLDIPKHFPQVKLDAHTIMPNHLHGILKFKQKGRAQNFDIQPDAEQYLGIKQQAGQYLGIKKQTAQYVRAQHVVPVHIEPESQTNTRLQNKFQKIITGSLGVVIRGFKSGVTAKCRQMDMEFSWQKNYYEHIIRDEADLNRIRAYIRDNVINWSSDRNNNFK